MAQQTKKQAAKKVTAKAKAKRAQEEVADQEVTSVSDWKKSSGVEDAGKLALPSGNVCLARNPGMEPFVTEGLIPNSLMSIILKAVNEGKPAQKEDLTDIMDDPSKLHDVLRLADSVLVRCVVAPKVTPVPLWTEEDAENEECDPEDVGKPAEPKRKPDRLYPDEVDLDDKMFIMQWVMGGTRDLERFRQEQTAVVDDLSERDEMAGATK